MRKVSLALLVFAFTMLPVLADCDFFSEGGWGMMGGYPFSGHMFWGGIAGFVYGLVFVALATWIVKTIWKRK